MRAAVVYPVGLNGMGRYSWQLRGFTTLGTVVMELVFHWDGTIWSLELN